MFNFDKLTTRPAYRVRIALLTPVVIGSLGLAACTSSGSSGTPGTSNPSSGATTTATSSTSSGARTSTDGASGSESATGGNSSSTPTSPAGSSSASVATANPLSYEHVSKKQAKKLEVTALRAPGVQNIAYAPKSKTLNMFMKPSATKKERITANRVVNQVLHPAATPSSSKTKKHRKHH